MVGYGASRNRGFPVLSARVASLLPALSVSGQKLVRKRLASEASASVNTVMTSAGGQHSRCATFSFRQNPNENGWKDPALEKLNSFCEESRNVNNDWVPTVTLPE